MSPFDDQSRDWQQRAARYRKMSTLLGEDETAVRLRALALEMEEQRKRSGQLRASAEELRACNAVLLAKIDAFLARARAAVSAAKLASRTPPFSAEDVREESRLCREEGMATEDMEIRRPLAWRALALAMLAEQIAREDDRPIVS